MLDQEYLKSVLHYNPESGIFTWKERPICHFKDERAYKIWNTRFPGIVKACLKSKDYVHIVINNKRYKAHRLAWLYIYGVSPKNIIDHINNNPYDNRICNLREANKSENAQNLTKSNSGSGCNYLGVSYAKHVKKYCAHIMVNYKSKYLGLFNTQEEAYEAYLKAKRKLHPFCTI